MIKNPTAREIEIMDTMLEQMEIKDNGLKTTIQNQMEADYNYQAFLNTEFSKSIVEQHDEIEKVETLSYISIGISAIAIVCIIATIISQLKIKKLLKKLTEARTGEEPTTSSDV